jgi:mitogen-activated protein kinase organizer 1
MLKTTKTLKAGDGALHVVKYNISGEYCLSGGQNREVTLWNPTSGSKIKTYEGHGWEVLDISISPDNARFASVGGDKAVYAPPLLAFSSNVQ